MNIARLLLRFLCIHLALLCTVGPAALGQAPTRFSPNIVIPQQKCYAPDSTPVMPAIVGIDATVTVDNTTAITELTVELSHPFSNESNIAAESREKLTAPITFSLMIPLPEGAALLSTQADGKMKGNFRQENHNAETALNEYRQASLLTENPNLLEFAGTALVRCGDFALPPGESGTFTITYRESLRAAGNRIDYTLPRSESFAFRGVPWNISLHISSPRTLAGVYSPSHPVSVHRESATQAAVSVQAFSPNHADPKQFVGTISAIDAENRSGRKHLDPGEFRLSWMIGNELTASFFAYPDDGADGGCLTMLAGAPPLSASDNNAIRREVILVIDRSGSMQGEKIEQVRLAAKAVLEELEEGEAFNIVDYADSVRQYSPTPTLKDENSLRTASDYVMSIVQNGGTNIRDALVTALAQKPTPGYLPIVIFLTDGVPTVGITQESRIREDVVKGNIYNRRIFTFGVGYDVNAPLLQTIATEANGTTTFALPFDDIGQKIAGLFRQLNGPVFSNIELRITRPDGSEATDVAASILPQRVNDLFDGDRIVLSGSYTWKEPLLFTLRGNYLGTERTFAFTFDPESLGNRRDDPWVCRLWANRKVTDNIVNITRAGAIPQEKRSEEDERELKKLNEEIVRLSTANGIITEYTDFLANPEIDVRKREELERMSEAKLKAIAQNSRTGREAVTAAMNNGFSMRNAASNRGNMRLDKNMQVVEVTSVQQIHDLTFFRRGNRWVDARILDSAETDSPDLTIRFGTPEYDRFLSAVLSARRQRILALDGDILFLHEEKIVLLAGAANLE